jgi:4-oxalocrotonate tautomerase
MPEVHVYMAAGRDEKKINELMTALTDTVVKTLGAPRDLVTVQIIEAPLTHKMKGGIPFTERA